jgi:hypothetical protein
MTPERVIRRAIELGGRRCSPAGTLARDPGEGGGAGPARDEYEQLLGLLRGVTTEELTAWGALIAQSSVRRAVAEARVARSMGLKTIEVRCLLGAAVNKVWSNLIHRAGSESRAGML